MGEHGAAGHVDIHVTRSLASLFTWHEVDLANVRDEVGVKNTAVIFREIFSLFREKVGLAGIDLRDISVSHHLIGKGANGPRAILALPIFELFRAHIPHERAANDRHAFRFDPFFIGTVLVHHELDIGMNLELFYRSCHSKLPPANLMLRRYCGRRWRVNSASRFSLDSTPALSYVSP